jgi:hypothetical protein
MPSAVMRPAVDNREIQKEAQFLQQAILGRWALFEERLYSNIHLHHHSIRDLYLIPDK